MLPPWAFEIKNKTASVVRELLADVTYLGRRSFKKQTEQHCDCMRSCCQEPRVLFLDFHIYFLSRFYKALMVYRSLLVLNSHLNSFFFLISWFIFFCIYVSIQLIIFFPLCFYLLFMFTPCYYCITSVFRLKFVRDRSRQYKITTMKN